MIGSRTIHSLAQFLELQPAQNTAVLFGKYGVEDLTLYPQQLLTGILDVLLTLSPSALMLLVAEAIATSEDLRARVSPKSRYDEREQDLKQCLILDGYMVV